MTIMCGPCWIVNYDESGAVTAALFSRFVVEEIEL